MRVRTKLLVDGFAPAVVRLTFASALMLCRCTEPPPMKKVLRPIRAAVPEARACAVASRFSGNIEPPAQVTLAFKRGGYIDTIWRVSKGAEQRFVEQGDVVRKGVVLARLRDADFRVKREQAKAQLAEARAARDQARQDRDRTAQLLESGVISKSLFEASETRAFATEAQVQAATALVEEAELAVADCVMRAPHDGVLWKRLIEVGSLVGPGTSGFILADTTVMKVVFGVPDMMLRRVRVGATLQVSVEALGPLPFPGRIARVAPMADPKSRLFDVEILLPNPDGRFRAGMIASLKTPDEKTRPALALPLSAVVRPPGSTKGFAVFVVKGDVLRVRRIETGAFCADRIEISRGLRPDERVVVEGAAQSFDGERVALVE